jgi:hypothetical protein
MEAHDVGLPARFRSLRPRPAGRDRDDPTREDSGSRNVPPSGLAPQLLETVKHVELKVPGWRLDRGRAVSGRQPVDRRSPAASNRIFIRSAGASWAARTTAMSRESRFSKEKDVIRLTTMKVAVRLRSNRPDRCTVPKFIPLGGTKVSRATELSSSLRRKDGRFLDSSSPGCRSSTA